MKSNEQIKAGQDAVKFLQPIADKVKANRAFNAKKLGVLVETGYKEPTDP